jgi:hypothetical protein
MVINHARKIDILTSIFFDAHFKIRLDLYDYYNTAFS